jgi:hypothetical protein
MNELFGKESAQAIGKVADTVAKGIDAAREFGSFFSQHFGGTVEQGVGLWKDKLFYRRWKNRAAFQFEVKAKINELGLEGKLRPLEMKIGVPLLEAASLQDDPDIQELWAQMLVNAINPDHPEIKYAFITILNELEKKDVLIFDQIYTYRKELVDGKRGPENLPEGCSDQEIQSSRDRSISQIILKQRLKQAHSLHFSNNDVEIALWNLIRLGCLNQTSGWGGLTIERVEYTPLGIALFEACSTKEKS